ncbi:hypothetical protein JCM17843_06490 [Kordiimonadales bacterium JCM 17843]|nr:hypothetical protein JCM17843_06490 [Kordiimonadales bacterium JCM 17843]
MPDQSFDPAFRRSCFGILKRFSAVFLATAMVMAAPYAPAWANDTSKTTGTSSPAVLTGNGALYTTPSILGPDDQALYRSIFDLQADGKWRQADA